MTKQPIPPLQPGPRAARKAAQPQRILAAALEAFGEKGFAATRMEDVAKKVGITKGAIYLYFPSKQALLEALARTEIAPFVAGISAQMRQHDGPLEPILRRITASAIAFMSQGVAPTYARIIISEARNFPEIARFHLDEVVSVILGGLSDLFGRAMARGEMREMEPETAARLFVAPIVKSLLWRSTFAAIEEKPFDVAAYLDAHVSVFLRGMAPDKEPCDA